MERFVPLLLDVWREVCRHIEIAEAVDRLAPLLVRKLPADRMLVRRLDLARSCVETVAASGGDAGAPRSELAADELEGLTAWCRAGRVLHLADDA